MIARDSASISGLSERSVARTWSLVGRLNAGGDSVCTLINPIPFSVGRRPEASLTLPRQTISGMHAELYTADESLFLRDLGSTNGTYVNGERIFGESPVAPGDFIQFADMPFQVSCEFHPTDLRTMCEDVCDQALALVQFQTLIREQAVVPHYQPIVEFQSGKTVAFEVLARSRMVGLETAYAMFTAAAELGMEAQLSDLMRIKGIEVGERFYHSPHLFLNTHPNELRDGATLQWLSALREAAPVQKLTIEIHEAAVTDVRALKEFRAVLDAHNIGLAFDDFGAGQARIAELAEVRADFLKFDRRIIQDIDTADSNRRRFVKCLVDAVRDIGIVALAEGVETAGEFEVCRDLGFDLAQGYFLGRPGPVEQYCAAAEWVPQDHVAVCGTTA